LSGIAAVLGTVSLMLFFTLENPQAASSTGRAPDFWGPVSDICQVVQMAALLVVAPALYRMVRSGAPRLGLIGIVVGVAGMLGVVLLQTLLIFGVIPFEQEVGPVTLATAAVGVWMIVANHVGRRQGVLPPRLGWLGFAVGAAFVLQPVLLTALGGAVAWRAMMSNYLLLAGSAVVFLVSYVGFPIWAIWLGRLFTEAGYQASPKPDVRPESA
jgi:hypothetical protein